jgi:L-lactate dehydrogenase
MKISIIGTGQVGSASAYACVLKGVGSELYLLDQNADFARAQAEDILHATPFGASMPVSGGNDYAALTGSRIVVIAAGVAQKPGESRLDLMKRNADIFEQIIPKILDAAPEAILLIASNPVDVMTHMVTRIAARSHNIPSSRVIGSGTVLDTARFRTLLGTHLGVSSHSVHAYVLGEHGDSEVLHWSGARIGTMSLGESAVQLAAPITETIRQEIDQGVRHAAARIIKGKGATWYGIGAGIARIAEAILDDQHAVVTCSTLSAQVEGIENVTLSLPRIIAAGGIEHSLYPSMDDAEHQALHRRAAILKEAAQGIGYS